MARLCEQFHVVPLQQPEDIGAAKTVLDSINMKNYSWCSVIIQFGDNTADNALTIYEGATLAAETSAITFSYRLSSGIAKASTNSDVFGSESTSAALTLTAATYQDKCLVVNIDPATMTDGYNYLTFVLDGSATVQYVSAVAILWPKYAEASAHTAIV